jgi:ATP-binding cassette subfamily F protein 3
MRQVEMSSCSGSSSSGENGGKAVRELNFEERKQVQRAVSNAEKKVEQLEAKISDLEARMALPDFYQRPDYQKVMLEYETAKVQLENAMMEWMEAQESLG